MKNQVLLFVTIVVLSASILRAQDRTDSSPHTVQFVTVDQGVKLEVLDWGGTGRPLVFLAGLGRTAHVYDQFAPKFTAKYHVYGITRRGWGASSKPAPTVANYSADRLGDDVLALMDALKLNRPVLAGHSIAGEELSSIGSRYPEKVAGLIYLDASDGYGYYDRVHGNMWLDMLDLKRRLDALRSGAVLDQQFVQDALTSASRFEEGFQELSKRIALMPGPAGPASPPIALATLFGEQKYTEIHAPVLTIFACPHNFDAMFPSNSPGKAAVIANDLASCSTQAAAFAAGIPSAHVVRLPNADHFVFLSNEADVLQAMNSFLATLPN